MFLLFYYIKVIINLVKLVQYFLIDKTSIVVNLISFSFIIVSNILSDLGDYNEFSKFSNEIVQQVKHSMSLLQISEELVTFQILYILFNLILVYEIYVMYI